jgi:hypothetical protein
MKSSSKQYGQVWTKLPSHIIIPAGTFQDHAVSTRSLFAELGQKVDK